MKQIQRYVFLLLVIITTGCSGSSHILMMDGMGSIDLNKGIYHEVKKGQTLWRISKDYGVNFNLVAKSNHIRDYTSLREGQLLFIPGVQEKKEVSVPRKRITFAKVSTERIFFHPLKGGRLEILFGEDKGRIKNKGIDIRGREGSPILASKTGVVTFTDEHMRGMGCIVVLDHQDGYNTVYAHLGKVWVKEGDQVKRGQKIAMIGVSGDILIPTLHFEIRKEGKAVNPLSLLPKY